MDRQKIKAEAKRIIKGNLGTILKPYGIILLIGIFLENFLFQENYQW